MEKLKLVFPNETTFEITYDGVLELQSDVVEIDIELDEESTVATFAFDL